MTATIRHRGPDDSGLWHHDQVPLSFGHRRLSILDLSPLGRQPMSSPDGSITIVYNGEIYNFRQIRNELESADITFRGESDTEVLVVALQEWGVSRTLAKLNGMFAFAAWDERSQALTLARDRMGIKPLYYGWYQDRFAFASEPQAFRADKEFLGEIDRDVAALYFRYNYIPAPHSIYSGIFKLPQGTSLTLSREALRHRPSSHSIYAEGAECSPQPYWRFPESSPTSGRRVEATEVASFKQQCHELLLSAVKDRLVSDVPIGAFLSGGIDSSLVVAAMKQVHTGTVRTFSIGFEEDGYNEAPYAKQVADSLGTEHTEMYVRGADALALIPQIPSAYGEPFADSSQIPTMLLSKLTREHVTVSLSGDGGDELFGGYERYLLATQVEGWMKRYPLVLRKVARLLPEQVVALGFSFLRPFLPARFRTLKVGDRFSRGAAMLSSEHPEEMYRQLIAHQHDSTRMVAGSRELELTPFSLPPIRSFYSALDRYSYIDAMTYLPDDILTKVDRASMAFSLEARTPLLDHRLVEFACTVPAALKVRNGEQKWLLKELLSDYVPRSLIDRPKMGFGVPLAEWLRGPLKQWGEELLSESALSDAGLAVTPIRKLWQEHQSKVASWHYLLWDVLVYQQWRESLNTPLEQPSRSCFSPEPARSC